MICVTEGCGKPVDSKGRCGRCYQREYMRKRRADPEYRGKSNERDRAYRRANPEKVRETKRRVRAKYRDEIAAYMAGYRRSKADEIRESNKAWRAANRDKVLAGKKRYRARNHVKIIAKAKEWAISNPEKRDAIERKYREANKEQTSARSKAWREKYPHRHAEKQKAREALRRQAMPSWARELDYQAVYEAAARLTRETGIKHHVDHIVPLKGRLVSGLHVPWNLQPIPATDNLRKSNRFEE